ncbi:MAG: hypothetical protein ABSA54_21820 [Terriglobales bacterium]|jgi:hypothetical protein
MNLGLLPANARLPGLPSTYRAVAGAFSEGRRRQVVLWTGARARKIIGLDKRSTAGTPGETGVILLSVPDAARRAKPGFLLAM